MSFLGRACPFGALALLLAVIGAGGCASPDEPTARQRPIIPQAVQDLQARQQGDEVVLSFTLPGQSVRNEALAASPAVEIYRGAVEAGGKPPEKVSTKLIYTIPGEMVNSYAEEGKIVFRDRIEPSELAHAQGIGAGQTYVVRTRVERNRASAESNRVVARIYAPPEAVGEVRTAVAERAVTLEWLPAAAAGGAGEYRVYRAELAPGSAAAAADVSPASLLKPLRLLGPVAETKYRDSNFEWGHTYMYVVRRVVQMGGDTVESADSKPAVITPAEVQPPAAPQGVEAVVVPASQQAAYVSLSWAISSEAGVAGYVVYRSEQADARGTRLNENLLGSPTYRDLSVTPGSRYFYTVTAVDGAGQESTPSAAVEVQVPQ
jgi:hypothetical protein